MTGDATTPAFSPISITSYVFQHWGQRGSLSCAFFRIFVLQLVTESSGIISKVTKQPGSSFAFFLKHGYLWKICHDLLVTSKCPSCYSTLHSHTSVSSCSVAFRLPNCVWTFISVYGVSTVVLLRSVHMTIFSNTSLWLLSSASFLAFLASIWVFYVAARARQVFFVCLIICFK